MSGLLKSRSRLETAAVIFLIYTLKLLLLLPQVWFYNTRSAAPVPAGLLLSKLALGTYSWAALTPLILVASRRWQIERHNLFGRLLTHFGLGLVFATAQTFIYHAGLSLVAPAGAFEETPRLDGPWSFVFNGVLAYASVLAVHQAILHFRKSQEREFRLQQAQLQILKMQLHPHFLFNTLNTVVQLIHENQRAAEQMVVNLSDMLRTSLYQMDEQEVTLKQELAFVEKYLEIMKARFEESFEVRMEIDPRALNAYVPTMILQPLVENSIRHGLAPEAGRGRIVIRAERDGPELHLSIADDGVGLRADDASTSGQHSIGLANTRERLRYLYGAEHRFELRNLPGRGVAVHIRLPFRESADESRVSLT